MSPLARDNAPRQAISAKPHEVSVHTALELQDAGIGEIIDVRQSWELELSPTVPDAAALPLYTIKGFLGHPLSEEEREEAPAELILDSMPSLIGMLNEHAKQGTILLCLCRSGNRSQEAVKLLHFLGYRNAVSIKGGINAWHAAGFPTIRPSS